MVSQENIRKISVFWFEIIEGMLFALNSLSSVCIGLTLSPHMKMGYRLKKKKKKSKPAIEI